MKFDASSGLHHVIATSPSSPEAPCGHADGKGIQFHEDAVRLAAGRLEPVYKGTGVRGAYVFTAEAVDGLREKAAS